MNRHTLTILTLLAILMSAAALAFAQDSTKAPADTNREYFVIETTHKHYATFKQVDTVGFGEPFSIGEDEWKATILMFNPHLGITTDGEALQMSDTLYNPAVRIRVEAADSVIQESWAFYRVEAPHFYRNDMLGFRILDFHVGDKYVPVPPKD